MFILQGSKLTNKGKELEGTETSHPGRTLEEARKLVEQSFGNYVGSNVVVAAEEELKKIKQDIELLSSEITDEAIDRKCQEQLTEEEYAEISVLQEQLRVFFFSILKCNNRECKNLCSVHLFTIISLIHNL